MSNILHITEAGGGVLEVIKNIIKTDSNNQHLLLIRRRDFSSLTIERADLDFEIHFWNGNLVKAAKSYLEINRSTEIDTVHMHSSRAGLLRLLIFGPSKVYSPHCFAFQRLDIPPVMRWIYKMIESILLRFTDGFLGVNSFEADWVARKCPRIKTRIYEYVAPPGSRIRNTKRIISVGRICKQKDPEKFAQIISSLRKIGSDVEAIWVGDGDKKGRVFLENNDIQVTGWRHSEEVANLLTTSRILLHTAKWEGMPVVFYEAWSIGLPIIVAEADYLANVSSVSRFQTIDQAVELIKLELETESRTERKMKSVEIAMQELQDFYRELRPESRLATNED